LHRPDTSRRQIPVHVALVFAPALGKDNPLSDSHQRWAAVGLDGVGKAASWHDGSAVACRGMSLEMIIRIRKGSMNIIEH
jgi:hypothetical protein